MVEAYLNYSTFGKTVEVFFDPYLAAYIYSEASLKTV